MKLKYIIIVAALLASCSTEKTYKIGVSQCGPGQWREKVKSKKRKIEPVNEEERRHVNVTGTKAGKILVLILCAAMIAGLLFAAVWLMIQAL